MPEHIDNFWMQIYQKHPNTITKKWHEEEIQNYTNDHHYDYNHGSILVNGTNLPSILAEHLDVVTSIENFDSMSKPSITARAYLRGGFRGFKPPPKFSDFFLKSEGKEIERKRKKRMFGGGGGTS